MNKTVLITSLDKIFDAKLAEAFAREGFDVYAISNKPLEGVTLLPADLNQAADMLREKTGKLDFLLDTTDIRDDKDNFTIRDGLDTTLIESVYRQNILRSMALLEAFLPMLDEGAGKRLFYLTCAGASINETRHINRYGYNMAKAALHQFLQMARNKLAPKGYTFRVFDPMHGDVSPEAAAESAFNYITRRRGTENHDPMRDDEDNLVFRDALGRQHTW
jgi:NAD(P)-dependent dehydrogenase (short-subunit alcohol dehydrogenase family)